MKWVLRVVAVLASLAVVFGMAWGYQNLVHPRYAPYKSMELEASTAPPSGVRATFFGVSTVLIDDGQTAVMVDGFFTRPGLKRLVAGKIASDPERVRYALERGKVGKLAAVLVSHSHHDHALDSAAVAQRTGAIVVGSPSTAFIALGAGLPADRIKTVRGFDSVQTPGFSIDVIPALHSPGNLFPGVIEERLEAPARASAFKDGGSFSFVLKHPKGTILVQPSANYIPGRLKDVKADVVLLGIGGLGKQSKEFASEYWKEVVTATGARLVIPIHWDDFTLPLDQPLQPMPMLMDDFDAAMAKVRALGEQHNVPVRLMRVFEPVDVLAAAR